MTQKARSAFWQSFYDETDPELPTAERERQAEASRKLYMTRLSRRAAHARTLAARAAQEVAEVLDEMAVNPDVACGG
jgi:hypothetical protein